MRVALVHDYLTQRGGAERVVLSLARAFPKAPIYTSLFDPDGTFPEFDALDVRPSVLDRVPLLRKRHRWAFPFLAPVFSAMFVDADVVLCSSSGWAHGVRTGGRKLVYCHTPARWLYQTDRYVRSEGHMKRLALNTLRRPLVAWDQRRARSADEYLANSSVVAERIRDLYGRESTIVRPPHLIQEAPPKAVPALPPKFVLAVSRLLPHKNIDVVIDAFRLIEHRNLVVVGDGPARRALEASAPPNVSFVGVVSDSELRWLYERSSGLVSAAHEDFGITPLEAAAAGRPVAVLRWGGFLDTVLEGETGVFFDRLHPDDVAAAVEQIHTTEWSEERLQAQAGAFSEERFIDAMRAVVKSVSTGSTL